MSELLHQISYKFTAADMYYSQSPTVITATPDYIILLYKFYCTNLGMSGEMIIEVSLAVRGESAPWVGTRECLAGVLHQMSLEAAHVL